jgi:hypothetical protein
MNDESRRARTKRLRADCTRCCGLCCAAPAFMAVQGFGFDKPAHTACRYLGADHRCVIHAELVMRGFPACAAFDCYGAGQWVTQLFAGKSWRSAPEIAARMFTLYTAYRALHELMALLDFAITQVPAAEAMALESCLREIQGLCEAGTDLSDSIDLSALRGQVRSLLVK